jgi:uncharacterized protein (TIGR03067 family)
MQDIEALQGAWEVVAVEVDGRKMPGGSARITLRGDRFIATGMGADYEGTIKLAMSGKTKSLDMTFDSGPEKGNTNLASSSSTERS